MKRKIALIAFSIISTGCSAQQNPSGQVNPANLKVADVFAPLHSGDVRLMGGFLGGRVDANAKNRMLTIEENELLDAFERREVKHQDWAGEHIGKYLHAASLTWSYAKDPALKSKLDRLVARLLKTQESDGYLGTYKKGERWRSWDVWVHKYDLLGLLAYYQATRLANGDKPTQLGNEALEASRRVANLLINTFGFEPGKADINKSGEHVGMAPSSVLEPIVLLYGATADKRYLNFANYIVKNYDSAGGPAILTTLEKKRNVKEVANAKAYEMLSNFNGLLELYRVNGDKRILTLMQAAWADIVKNRLYVTGSASAGEHFQDPNVFHNGMNANICETCVTVTWQQMNLELLRLTGDARHVDELEKTTYNHLLAAQKPSGDDWAYYTPLEGRKPYDNFTTCCHSSGPRGIALVPGTAFMTSSSGALVVNFYNDGTAETRLPAGHVGVAVKTNYPVHGDIQIRVNPERAGQKFPILLRIPAWTTRYSVAVNGKPMQVDPRNIAYSHYYELRREWAEGDVIDLKMTVPDRIVIGQNEAAGRSALLHGPLVLAHENENGKPASALKRFALRVDPSMPSFGIAPGISTPENPTFTLQGDTFGGGRGLLSLIPYADAGSDGKRNFSVWINNQIPSVLAESLLVGRKWESSRKGNQSGDLTDDDFATYAVTYDTKQANEDWFSVRSATPITINRVVFVHGRSFHDGGWFDTQAGSAKPSIQVQTELNGPWKTVATLDSYPAATATSSAGLKNGQAFSVKFASMRVFGVRVLGRPAHGDNPAQSFVSCAELQAFMD